VRRLGLIALAATSCVTADPSVSEIEALAQALTEAEADFRPHRQMAEDGRATPILGRQCSEGMARDFRPDLPDAVASTWLALGEFFALVVETVPPLVEAAEAQPDQEGEKHRVMWVSDALGVENAGGMISLRRRRARPRGLLVRERLDTTDLWRRDPVGQTTAYFDGWIEYGAADSPDLPQEAARAKGWAQVWRPPPEPMPFLVGAQVDFLLLDYGGDEIRVTGHFVSPCYGQVRVDGSLAVRRGCPAAPASRLQRFTFEHGKRTLVLEQDDAPCDGCAWWSHDGGEPVRFCPELWQAPDEAGSASTERVEIRGPT
jgi:hypothetical protein